MDEKICHKCHSTFSPDDHGQGLVINDHIFLCETCSQDSHDHNEADSFDSSKQIRSNEMPIALWLIKEQNKGKTFMSAKK